MIIFGEEDAMIPPSLCPALADSCLHTSQSHAFPSCGHAFAHRPVGTGEAEAAGRALDLAVGWLDNSGGQR